MKGMRHAKNSRLFSSGDQASRGCRRFWAAMSLLACLNQACGVQRVTLTAPPSDAPLDERIAAFENLEATGHEYHQGDASLGSRQGSAAAPTALVLRDGTRVYDPRDLRPLLREDSESAAAIADYSRRRKRRLPFLVTSAITTPLGFFGALLGAVAWGEEPAVKPIALTGIGLLVVGIATGIGAAVHGVKMRRAKKRTLRNYDRDLLIRLDLERVPGAVKLVPVEVPGPDKSKGVAALGDALGDAPVLSCELCP